jgi:hypothetical protein
MGLVLTSSYLWSEIKANPIIAAALTHEKE